MIGVPEDEYKPLLDRGKVKSDIQEHLKPWCQLLREVTSYGSNLLPRCFSSSDRSMKDTVVLGILLRQVVAMLDGVEILLSEGACHAAQLQMRALFEASVYLEWILKEDSETKAFYYYVHNLRRRRLWAARTQPNSSESQEFIKMIDKSGLKLNDAVVQSSGQQLTQIDQVLSQPNLVTVTEDFDKHRGEKKYDPAWYVPLGQRNFRSIAKEVDKLSQYELLYSGASEVMHSSSYDHHVRIGHHELTFEPVRSLEGFENVFRFSVAVAFSTFRRILEEYRPGELSAFSRKYMEKWRREFMNFPRITYQVNFTRI